jgi:hypothetical protein
MSIRVVRRKDLPWSEVAHEFVGDEHGRVPIALLLVDAVDVHASPRFVTDWL